MSFLFSILFFIKISFAQSTTSFCFEKNQDFNNAKSDVSDLILAEEKILDQKGSLCFDLVVSNAARVELFEKLLRRRYKISTSFFTTPEENLSCQITLETIGTKNVKNDQVLVSSNLKINTTEINSKQTNVQTFKVMANEKGRLQICDSIIEVICRVLSDQKYQLKFSHSDSDKSVETMITLAANTKFDLGNVIKEINDKKKKLGIPETSWIKTEGFETVNYSLLVQ